MRSIGEDIYLRLGGALTLILLGLIALVIPGRVWAFMREAFRAIEAEDRAEVERALEREKRLS